MIRRLPVVHRQNTSHRNDGMLPSWVDQNAEIYRHKQHWPWADQVEELVKNETALGGGANETEPKLELG